MGLVGASAVVCVIFVLAGAGPTTAWPTASSLTIPVDAGEESTFLDHALGAFMTADQQADWFLGSEEFEAAIVLLHAQHDLGTITSPGRLFLITDSDQDRFINFREFITVIQSMFRSNQQLVRDRRALVDTCTCQWDNGGEHLCYSHSEILAVKKREGAGR